MKIVSVIILIVIGVASVIIVSLAASFIAGISNVHNNLSKSNVTKVGFLSNEEFINGLYNNLNLTDAKQVFRFVFSNLDDQVVIYPTENYYYFTFPAHGKIIFGSIALPAYYRDQGVLFFGYYEKMEKFLETVSRLLSASDRAMGQPLLETCCVKDWARSLPSEVTGQ